MGKIKNLKPNPWAINASRNDYCGLQIIVLMTKGRLCTFASNQKRIKKMGNEKAVELTNLLHSDITYFAREFQVDYNSVVGILTMMMIHLTVKIDAADFFNIKNTQHAAFRLKIVTRITQFAPHVTQYESVGILKLFADQMSEQVRKGILPDDGDWWKHGGEQPR